MADVLNSQPWQDGFAMPAESHPQQAVWLAWPERTDNWRDNAKPAQRVFSQLAVVIARYTPVVMVVSQAQFSAARSLLPSHIHVVEMAYDDCWLRDIGATYLINAAGQRRGVSWQFNAWGGLQDGLYQPWDNDNKFAESMLQHTGDDCYQAPLILEGGSFHCDGEGTVYTTEECLLHPSRNPNLSQRDIEQHLQNYLGAEKVIWLPKGIHPCDETNGHVDNLLHIAHPGEVLLSVRQDEKDPLYEQSQAALALLRDSLDARGRAINVHCLPVPGPLYRTEKESQGIDHIDSMARKPGEQLAGSYSNFLITNGAVIFPLLDSQYDRQAEAVLQQAFSDYDIIGFDAREILLGGGNIHCITQQVPAV